MAYIAQVVGVVGTLTAAFIAVRSYVNANRRAEEARARELETRHSQLYMQINNQINSPEMLGADFDLMTIDMRNTQDYVELCKDKEKYVALAHYGIYYEGIGILVREGLLDIKLISRLLSGPIIWYWEKYGPGYRELRREMNFPRLYVEVEYLYDRIKEYGMEHPELGVTSPVDI